MPRPLLFLFVLNTFVVFALGFYNSFLLLLVLLPWTIFLFIAFNMKGFTFDSEDPIYKFSGKLYFVGKGSFQATLIASLNLVLTALIVPNDTFTLFDQQFGIFSSILVLILLPMPGFYLFIIKGKDQDRLYNLIYQNMIVIGEAPFFTLLTNNLMTKIQPYSDEYFKQIDKIRESVYNYLFEQYPNISSFIDYNQSYHLNLENLAFFLTKKTLTVDN